jgi:cell division protein FtsQ
MTRRPALALARPRPVPGGDVVSWRRWLELAAALAAAAALAYLAARFTPLFAVDEVAVSGASPQVAAEVREALGDLEGKSLVAVDGDVVIRRIEGLPSVRSVALDKAFPHTLGLVVVPERPLAVVAGGHAHWLVSEHGRVIGRVEKRADRRRPLVRLESAATLEPGANVTDAETRLALRTLALLPARFPVRVVSARTTGSAIILRLGGGADVRLGEPTALTLKLEVARRILASLPSDELASLAYVDVSVPARAVAANVNTQVEG